MKKLFTICALIAATACLSGCFTKAAAHAKKTTAPDGTLTLESDISIIGTGDKASQVAAEGMFADGADDTLGAGVKNAKASQQSTGIKETFEGMGTFMGGLGQFMAASQGVPKVAAIKPAADVEGEDAEPAVTATAAEPKATATPRSVITSEGAPILAILGNRATCPRCRALWQGLDSAALATALCGASVIDADKSENAAEYARIRPSGGFSYPLALVYAADGTLAGQFSAAGMSQAQLVDKVKALVPACAAPPAVKAVAGAVQ
jgi:hypothetical protein